MHIYIYIKLTNKIGDIICKKNKEGYMGRFGEWKGKGEMMPNMIIPKIKLKKEQLEIVE